MSHYIAGSGMHGCLYDHCEVYDTLEDAVQGLASLFELGSIRASRLRQSCYLELTPTFSEEPFGADYCEITVCGCKTPWVHSDSGEE